MKIVVNYLNFIFHIVVKTKSNHKFLNFDEMALWVHGLFVTCFKTVVYILIFFMHNVNMIFICFYNFNFNKLQLQF